MRSEPGKSVRGRALPWMIALLLALIALALFAIRPWSDHSPLAMNSLFAPDKRIENFRHLDRIFPARDIPAGDAPFAFDRDERALEVRYRYAGEERTLDDFLERVVATGLLVIKDDRIVHERYMHGADETSTFTSWSVAKSFVGTLVGMALDEGRIASLDDAISDYVPELVGSGYDGVPIRHVLQMSSGVDFEERYDVRFSDIQRFFWRVFVFGRRADAVMGAYESARPSGGEFGYISIDTQALGMMLQRVHEQSLSALLSERLWQPLGMEADAFWTVDRAGDDGMELAFCCINARLRDYAKLGRLYLHQGQWQGEALVSADWIHDATSPAAPHLEPGAMVRAGGPRGYAYQWWVPEGYQREYFASGVWGQYIYVSEPDDLIIVRTSVDPDFLRNVEESVVVFRAIRDALR